MGEKREACGEKTVAPAFRQPCNDKATASLRDGK
jgi:hypothetical protein